MKHSKVAMLAASILMILSYLGVVRLIERQSISGFKLYLISAIIWLMIVAPIRNSQQQSHQ